MKRNLTALALATVLLLSGCGGNDSGKTQTASQPTQEAAPENTVPSDTPVQEPEESAEPDKTEDHVLSTLEASVDGGRVLTLCAIGKQRADMDQWGVREVRVYEGNTLLQTISVQEAIDADGVDGIDTGYTQCWSAEEAMSVEDLNFDGSGDLDLFGWIPASNTVPHYYWLWDSGSNSYRYALSLQGASVDAQAQEVISQYHYENGVDYTDYYAPDDSGNLVLVRREIADWTQGDGQAPLVTVYTVKIGQLTLAQ